MNTTFAELTVSESRAEARTVRRIRIYAPNTLDLDDPHSTIGEIELGRSAGLIFEDAGGVVVGWMLPGERLRDSDLANLRARRAYVISMVNRTPRDRNAAA